MGSAYSAVGREIHPGMVVNLAIADTDRIDPCPDRFRIVIARSGSAYVELKGVRVLIAAPAVLCLNGDEDARTVKAEGLSCIVVHFEPNAVNFKLDRATALLPWSERVASPFAHDIFWLDPFIIEKPEERATRIGPGTLKRATELAFKAKESLDKQSDLFWPCRSRSYFLELLFLIRDLFIEEKAPDGIALDRAACTGALPARLEDALLYLHTHFAEEIGLEGLAAAFSTNRTSLNALFREHLGRTVIQYLISIRVAFACLVLRDTTVPVKEVVYRSGFNDFAHFNRTFKKATSMTPAEYREEYCLMLKG